MSQSSNGTSVINQHAWNEPPLSLPHSFALILSVYLHWKVAQNLHMLVLASIITGERSHFGNFLTISAFSPHFCGSTIFPELGTKGNLFLLLSHVYMLTGVTDVCSVCENQIVLVCIGRCACMQAYIQRIWTEWALKLHNIKGFLKEQLQCATLKIRFVQGSIVHHFKFLSVFNNCQSSGDVFSSSASSV